MVNTFDRKMPIYRNDAFAEIHMNAVHFIHETAVFPISHPEAFIESGIAAHDYIAQTEIEAKFGNDFNRTDNDIPIYVGKAVTERWRQNRVSITTQTGTKLACESLRMLSDPARLYWLHASPVTRLGTYQKTCREWIVSNNLYNDPVSDEKLETGQPLRSVQRLVLTRSGDSKRFFAVEGCEIVGKRKLAELGYPSGKRHPASQKDILYKLSPLGAELAYEETSAVAITGRGTHTTCSGGAGDGDEPRRQRCRRS